MSDSANTFAASMKICRAAFGKCRKYEDDVGTIIQSCGVSATSLKSKLKSLTANSAALTSAKTKITSLASKKQRAARAISTCADLITAAEKVLKMVSENPASKKIKTLATEISSVGTITCTTTQKSS